MKGNVTAFSSFGVSGSSLGGPSLLLKKIVKGNVVAFPSFGVTRSVLKLSLSLKKLAQGNDVAFPSLRATTWPSPHVAFSSFGMSGSSLGGASFAAEGACEGQRRSLSLLWHDPFLLKAEPAAEEAREGQ